MKSRNFEHLLVQHFELNRCVAHSFICIFYFNNLLTISVLSAVPLGCATQLIFIVAAEQFLHRHIGKFAEIAILYGFDISVRAGRACITTRRTNHHCNQNQYNRHNTADDKLLFTALFRWYWRSLWWYYILMNVFCACSSFHRLCVLLNCLYAQRRAAFRTKCFLLLNFRTAIWTEHLLPTP